MNAKAEMITMPGISNVPTVADGLMHMIERVARDPSIDLVRLQTLMEMHERITLRNAEQAFNDALSQAQTEMRPVAQDSSNPQTKSRYASYAALDEAIRPTYTSHGFALSFNTGDGAPEQHVRVLCEVSHRGGHTRRYHIDMPADGKGAKGGDVMTRTHATGSAVTYGMRYLLKMIFNIAVGERTDDDGNSAGKPAGIINDKQYHQLIELSDNVGADKELFCRYFKIDGVAYLPAAKFDIAVAMLNAKKKKAGNA